MTREEFIAIVGREPSEEEFEMDRANCNRAGEKMHEQCGLCEHGFPRFAGCPRGCPKSITNFPPPDVPEKELWI